VRAVELIDVDVESRSRSQQKPMVGREGKRAPHRVEGWLRLTDERVHPRLLGPRQCIARVVAQCAAECVHPSAHMLGFGRCLGASEIELGLRVIRAQQALGEATREWGGLPRVDDPLSGFAGDKRRLVRAGRYRDQVEGTTARSLPRRKPFGFALDEFRIVHR